MRYVIREARPTDLDAIESLAERLDTMNLPRDRALLSALLERSGRSFGTSGRGRLSDPQEAVFVFALEDRERGEAIGTSLVIAKHGTLASPHFFMEMRTEDRHSDNPPRDFHHRVLRLGYTTDGPTEVGGLILHPDHRRAPEALGMQLSYVRFNFIARQPGIFQKEVLAELLSPLDEEGKNLFWEVYGKRFTGLTYREADRLSMLDKTFILSLFPQSDLYAALLPAKVQRLLGEVAPGARAARHLLTKIGLRPLEQIDPFDGGPYYGAPLDDVTIVRWTRLVPLSASPLAEDAGSAVIVSHVGKTGFRAVASRARLDADSAALPLPAREAIGARPGDAIAVTPLPEE
jgi:arginine N-succinyltransferase